MEKHKIKFLNDIYYYEKLDNGLEVYLFPDKTSKSFIAEISTPYGGIAREFTNLKTKKEYSLPQGVAHFLEHQLFSHDGVIIKDKFSSLGLDSNAGTGQKLTRYYFSGVNNFYRGLKVLLDYVQTPNFNDEGTKKEKGIIIEEAKMLLNRPLAVLDYEFVQNIFHYHPTKDRIIGEIEEIKKIKTQDLQDFYDHFYHPSQMVLAIAGNFDVKKTIELIKENQKNKKFKEAPEVKLKEVIEPLQTVKSFEVKEANIESTYCFLGYKMSYSRLLESNMSKNEFLNYIEAIIDNNFGQDTEFIQKLIDEQIINDITGFHIDILEDIFCIKIIVQTDKPEQAINEFRKKLNNISIDKKKLELYIKAEKSRIILATESKLRYLNYLRYYILEKIPFDPDFYSKKTTIDYELIKMISAKLDFSNEAILIANPKK